MAEKQNESISPGITGSSSHVASVYGNDFVELVWQSGQILVQGGSSSRTLKRPSCIGYSINPSHEAYDEDTCVTKRARLNTLYTLLDSSHQNSRQTNGPCSYPFDSKCTESNNFGNKPGDELSTLIVERESMSKPTRGNTQLCSTSLQTQKHDSGYDQRVGKINFSNFLRPALFFKSTCQGNSAARHPNTAVSARAEEIKATDGGSIKALDHSVVIDSAKGSHILNGVHPGRTAFTSNKANSTTPFDAKKDQEPLPDEQSEAVGYDRALKGQGSHGQYHQTHSRKIKTAAEFSSAPLVASSSLCSLGASNDPTLHSRKHEDTDDSTYTSDNDEETEDTVKETSARDGSRGKRIRNTQMHNLSERKRRDKINKKMRALKELIPHCNKMDKASMLDDAIDYLKTLKLQLQVLSMGSGVCMPMMMSMLTAGGCGHQLGMRPGIGMPCSLPPHQFGSGSILPQVPPHPHAIANNSLHQMLPGFPNQMLPNIQFPMTQSPFISMPPKPMQPYLSSHLTTLDHDSDLNAQFVSPMPKSTQGSK
ncbi:transcription factor PHYTOCHROME INTERACTING FACTOR-LIKE 15-like [Prosopis cineraria]|uniref:transcription factor PHYTOCHROME INTERACTING FACTOR-LIKE 15-like n=1 Tax=Prosopis cineraria TaxID=364024 RepID=UPI00240F92C6|nr:transcription factor PHYTOCHROME INTERACTING FACTOR-LIKE 15-like [Prosopis cineraria]XP_054800109.1 transcription factor PHYTOCHROME INTERACTING FACTOR-LIKE 15-like [Prosopis cineraria]XP_054800110.1 transcription factor PHYTOCHROME INTERACTING FACTOR-LIKE 15-like [Prosopis cineraria]